MKQQGVSPQKGILFAVLLLALFALVFGIIRVRQNLLASQQGIAASEREARQALVGLETQGIAPDFRDAAALATKDTDGDGLSDADELNRYKTSPYLKDTDSDGFDDAMEIRSANDPNCPTGKTCGAQLPKEKTVPSTLVLPSAEGGARVPPFDAQLLRDTLRKAGVTEEQLSSLDDAALKQLYDETLQEVGPTASAPAAPSQGLPSTPEALQNATPGELRALLKANGVPENILNAVDDATLKALLLESMKEKTP